MANFSMWNTPTLDEQLRTLRFELKLQLAVVDLETSFLDLVLHDQG